MSRPRTGRRIPTVEALEARWQEGLQQLRIRHAPPADPDPPADPPEAPSDPDPPADPAARAARIADLTEKIQRFREKGFPDWSVSAAEREVARLRADQAGAETG